MANAAVLSTVATFERKSSERESSVGGRPHRTNNEAPEPIPVGGADDADLYTERHRVGQREGV